MNPKPAEYYEAWYHAAVALQKQTASPTLARQTLASVMRLSPTLGSPEMKAKYQELVDQDSASERPTSRRTELANRHADPQTSRPERIDPRCRTAAPGS